MPSSIGETLTIRYGGDGSGSGMHSCMPRRPYAQSPSANCCRCLPRRSLQTPLQIAISNEKAHCVTLLRLATQAQQEHPGNAFADESFQQAMQMFLADWEQRQREPKE